jgi:hypothetical protein
MTTGADGADLEFIMITMFVVLLPAAEYHWRYMINRHHIVVMKHLEVSLVRS